MYKLTGILLIIISLNIFSQKSDAVKVLNAGVEAEKTSNYTEALFYYSMAIDLDSKYTEAYEKRGDVYRRIKNYGKAKQDYTSAVSLNQTSKPLWLSLSQMNYELTYYKEAISGFTKIIEIGGDDADIYYARGNAYNKNKEYDKAGADYTKALDLKPEFTEAREKLNKLISDNLYAGVVEEKKVEKKEETSVVKNEDKQITKNEETPVVKNEDTPVVKTEETSVVKTEEKPVTETKVEVVKTDEKPIAETKVEEVKTDEKPIAETKVEEVKTEEIKTAEETPIVIKTDVQDFIFKGLAFYEAKDFHSALAEYNKAVESDPGFAEAYYHRGRAYTELNDYESAIREYTKTIELNPGHEKAYINRGYIYNEMKIYKSAIKDFSRGIEINPNSVFGYYNMGVAYYSLGNKEKTVECFQAAARLGDMDSQDWLRSNGYSW